YAHLVSVAARKESEQKHLKAVACGHAIQLFVDRADEDLPPEALDGSRGLALFAEPIEHRDLIEVRALGLHLYREDRSCHGNLFTRVQEGECKERFGKMCGRRQHSRLKDAAAPTGLDENKLLVELDLVFDAETLVEVEKIDTAAQQDVLAVVDSLACALIGCG